MAFPSSPLDVGVELGISGAWTDITDDVRVPAGISITRGRADEGSRVDPGKCSLELNNRDGVYSPRNPNSPYFGLIGRNTPIRVVVNEGSARLLLPGEIGDKLTCPDAPGLDITGDLDVRLDLEVDSWRTTIDLAGKYSTAGDQRSWAFYLDSGGVGRLGVRWSPDGTLASLQEHYTVPPVPFTAGRGAVRFTLDVNDGAGGHVVSFYVADTIDGPWELLESITGTGTTSVHGGTAGLEVGDVGNLADAPANGVLHGYQLRNGIDGTVVASIDPADATAGVSTFPDGQGNTWTLEGGSVMSNRRIRFTGEVAAWPPRWDVAGRDIWVPIEAAGILRRLGQGASPLSSALFRGIVTTAEGLVAYWPLEDGPGSTQLASAVGGPAMRITGEPELEGFTDFAASNPILLLKNAELSGVVPPYDQTGAFQVRFLLAIPDGGSVNGQTICRIRTTGTARLWHLNYGTGGTLQLQAFSDAGTELDTGGIAFAVNGKLLLVSIELQQSGSDIGYNFLTLEPGAASGVGWSGTLAGETLGQVGGVIMSPVGGMDDVAIGHVHVQSVITSLFDQGAQLAAYLDEAAGERISRLCEEHDIPFSSVGSLSASTRAGYQLPAELLDLLTEAAEADGGILRETRDSLGLTYRTKDARYNTSASLTLDYSGRQVSPPFDPIEDDQTTRNDVTVSRAGGSSARATLEEGPLSVLSPPDGVGRYDESVTLNVSADNYLADQASWRVHVGTWDEARYPLVTVDLRVNPDLVDQVTALESGDIVTITNGPEWLPPGDIELVALGYTEVIEPFGWSLTFNCVPAGPWRVGVYDTARYGTSGSELASGVDVDDTSFTVTTTDGPRWTTDVEDFPLDLVVGGELVTVTAIVGASSPQTFTVTRGVNGVSKSHAAGAPVALYRPATRAL